MEISAVIVEAFTRTRIQAFQPAVRAGRQPNSARWAVIPVSRKTSSREPRFRIEGKYAPPDFEFAARDAPTSPRTQYLYYGARYGPGIFQTSPNNTEIFASSVVLVVPGVQTRGIFGATDAVTGQIAWKHDVLDEPARSGMVVAGDLVFYGQNDGTFNAANAANGDILWSFSGASVPNGGGANAAPIAYIADGKEFIVNAFGGSSSERRRRVSPLGDAVIAFALPDATYAGPHVVQGSH